MIYILTALILTVLSSSMNAHPYCVSSGNVIRTAAELTKTIDGVPSVNMHFDITATVISPFNAIFPAFVLEDSTGTALMRKISFINDVKLQRGDLIRATGIIQRHGQPEIMMANIKSIDLLSHNTPPEPTGIDWSKNPSEYRDRLVKVNGTVRDAFRDEIDKTWDYIQLQCDGNIAYVCLKSKGDEVNYLHKLIDAKISATGIYTPHWGMRRMIGHTIYAMDWDYISIINPAPSDPFNVPMLNDIGDAHLPNLSQTGRRRICGHVIAVWNDRHILLRSTNRSIVRVDLMESNPPKYGDFVEVAGRPETDLYRLNISRGIWRPFNDAGKKRSDETPEDITVRNLTMTEAGEPAFQTKYHGRAIRMKGRVISVPQTEEYNRLVMECDRQMVHVDASSCPEAFADVKIGCMIAASGTCLMESANWHPNAPFPHIERFSIIVRTPDDVEILSYPPWWTTGRLFAVIGALLALLSGIFIWNRMLNRLAERRGRELADEKLAHVTSDLKVYERTRLAVELHDSLSQNLTGVSLAIRAANRLADSDSDGMRQSLNVAAKALDSCRDELRNCLWDLRNQTLEETDMNEAIRQTLAPHIGDNTKLSVRFNVSRERLSDNTAHCILRIIRELASNAVRHGGASAIKIAGSIEEDRLLFSVCDNGCGFDPESRPNAADGHFGLQGIQDRVDGFEGELSIKSAPDAGAKVTVSIKVNIPKQAD